MGIAYLIKDALAVMMNSSLHDNTPYDYSCLGTKMQFTNDNAVWTRRKSVDFEIHLRLTIDNIVSPPGYLGKITKKLFKTDMFYDPVVHVVKISADIVMEASPNREEQFTRFPKSTK